MSTTAVGHCSQCDAVVNVRWPSCLVCHAALPATSREAGSLASSAQPGDRITWQRADGKATDGVIDFLHADHDGSRWAFCSVADRWVAVNTKFVTMVEEGGQN